MLVKTRGIIFKTIKYGESSLIVDLYTEQLGLQKYIVNSVRSRKPKVQASLMQVMSLVDLVAYHRPDRDLHRIKEIRPAKVYQAIPFNVQKGAVGLFMAEVARKTIRESEENDRLFRFLFESFSHLDSTPNSVANLHLIFLLELSGYLGFLPGGILEVTTPYFDLQEGKFVAERPNHVHYLDESLSTILNALIGSERTDSYRIKMKKGDRRKILRELLDYYRLHIEGFPEINAHLILQEVLEE